MKHSDKKLEAGFLPPALMIWTILVCLAPNVCLSVTEDMTLVQRITNVVLPGGIYWLLMSLTRNVGVAGLWMFILEFFAAFQLVLLYIYGRSVIAVDMFLNLVTTNAGEVSELLSAMMPVLWVVFLMYLPPIVASVVAVVRKKQLSANFLKRNRMMSLVTVCIGLVCYMLSFVSGSHPYNPLKDLYPVNVMYNVYMAFDRTVKTSHYVESADGYRFGAESRHPAGLSELYVLVIGETSRADNWELMGYSRRNNMRLASDTAVVAFNRAFSQSNTTHKSVPMLLSHIDATTFNDSIYSTAGILAAFREAGFHTAFISNQRRNNSFIDFMGEQADTTIFLKDNMSIAELEKSYDGNLLGHLSSIIGAGHRKQLVVLHTYGSHFDYSDRYPETSALYFPDSPLDVNRSCKEELVNAYDNSIGYTADFLADVTAMLRQSPGIAAMMYTSDHGEDIFDDGRDLFLHASPVPSYYQIHVPLVVWTSEGYDDALPDKVEALRDNRGKTVATNQVFFHTAMDMAGITSHAVRPEQAVSSRTFRPSQLLYLTDHNESVPLGACGLKGQDFDRFRALGIEL